jgi:CAAX protease family protein
MKKARETVVWFLVVLFLLEGLIAVVYLIVGETILMPTMIIASWTPNFAAFITLGLIVRERGRIRALLQRWVQVKVPAVSYLLVVIFVAIIVIAILIYRMTGGQMIGAADFRIGPLLVMIPIFLITGATGEELGWRGFMLGELQKRWSGLVAALITAPFWVLFHMPLWLRPEFGYSGIPFGFFALSTVALSVTLVYLVNKSGGSLFTVTLAHFLQNFGLAFIPALGMDPARFFVIYATLNTIYAVVAIAVSGKRLGKAPA